MIATRSATNTCRGSVANAPNRADARNQGLHRPVVDWSQRNEGGFMMNHAYGWMGGEMWFWSAISALVVVLLVVAINKLSDKKS